MTNINRTRLLAELSGNFLTKDLPNNWDTWEETKVDRFLEQHVLEQYEYFSTEDVWDLICNATNSAANVSEREKI